MQCFIESIGNVPRIPNMFINFRNHKPSWICDEIKGSITAKILFLQSQGLPKSFKYEILYLLVIHAACSWNKRAGNGVRINIFKF